MGISPEKAVGAVKHALAKCDARHVSRMAADYKAKFVPAFMAYLGLTDVKKVPAQKTLYAVYQAHKRKQTDVAVEPAPPPRSKRARRAPKQKED